MAAAIPTLADPPSRQVMQAIVDPLAYYRRCFRAHNGVVRVHMVPGLSPQQVLINDPAVLQELMNLSPRGVREHLKLNRPIYARTAAYGHFGREPDGSGGFSWERLDLVEQLESAFGV